MDWYIIAHLSSNDGESETGVELFGPFTERDAERDAGFLVDSVDSVLNCTVLQAGPLPPMPVAVP